MRLSPSGAASSGAFVWRCLVSQAAFAPVNTLITLEHKSVVAMVTPAPPPSRPPLGGRWLLLVSMGLHGLVLVMPTPPAPSPPESAITLDQTRDNANRAMPSPETMAVVQLPAAAAPAAEPATQNSSPPPSTSHRPTLLSPPASPETILPLVKAHPTPVSSVDPAPAPEVSPPPETAPDQPDPDLPPPGLTHNNKTVALTSDTQDFLAWYTDQTWETLDLIPLPGPKDLPKLQVPYEGTICLSIPPAPGRIEIIVGHDGQLYRPPRLLATTGYDDLDAVALALAAQQDYTDAANTSRPDPTVYWLPMEVLYQGPNCPQG